MQINLTNEASAKLLGINPACYTDEQLQKLSAISADAEGRMERFHPDSDEYAEAFGIKYRADWEYDERFGELNRGWR